MHLVRNFSLSCRLGAFSLGFPGVKELRRDFTLRLRLALLSVSYIPNESITPGNSENAASCS